MDKISAACAQEWSIQLEKGLRSKNSSQKIEAVVQIGPKFQQWSKEPPITMAVASMYGLVLGEDRLFANTILLRLADAFKNGDHNMRLNILRIFLLELGQRKKLLKPYNGILSKLRVPNYLELLRRVKFVFNTGDVKSRALSLRVIGCWADLAKDSADVRYMIISCLDSHHTLEVRASLFAAGCFSELSQDFAFFVLEVLVKMLTSVDTSTIVKLAAARAFSTLRASCFITSRAYEAGMKLVLNSREEEVKIAILSSLSKLASKSVLLFPTQVKLLISILDNGSVSNLTVKAMKFLLGLVEEGISCIPDHFKSVKVLMSIINNSGFPLNCQYDALKVLKKIFLHGLGGLNWMDMPEFMELVNVVMAVAQCRSTKKKMLALDLLVDISCKIVKAHQNRSSLDGEITVPLVSEGNQLSHLPKHTAMLLTDGLASLMRQVKERADTLVSIFTLKQESQYLLNIGLLLLKEFPSLGSMVLERVQCLIEEMLNVSNSQGKEAVMDIYLDNPILSFYGTKGLEEGQIAISKEAVLCLFKFLAAWLETLDEAGEITIDLCRNMNCFLEHIKENEVLKHDKCVIFSLIRQSRLIWHFLNCQCNTISDMEKYVNAWVISSRDCWFEHEQLVVVFAKHMVTRTDFLGAYRTGKYAACHAAWFSATFVFGLLSRKIHGSCSYWLKSLALFAGAESEILLLIFPKLGNQVISYLQVKDDPSHACSELVEEDGEVDLVSNGRVNLWDYREKLSRAYNRVCSAEEILEGATTSEGTFYFQRWFLSLRAEFFGALVDLLGHSNLENYDGQGLEDGVGEPGPQALGEHLAGISFRFNRLAKELDLLAASFMDMDYKSFRSIAGLAVCCSVLAFSTAYIFFLPNRCSQDKNNSSKFLVQDLVQRLWQIDRSICMDLYKIFKYNVELRGSKTLCRNQMPTCSFKERGISTVSRFSILNILQFLEELRPVKSTETLIQISQARLHLLFSIVRKMMCIPFQTPKYFFRMRPQVGAEIFISNADTQSSGRLSVSRGFQLSLNLCIQLSLPDCDLQISKIFCILAAKPSVTFPDGSGERKKQENSTSKHWKTNVDLNDVLLNYINEELGKDHQKGGDTQNMAKSFVSFKPTERKQGFSTSLLDVSSLPEGCYEIAWCSCCIDSKGSYWNLLPLNAGPVFTIYSRPSVCT
ncbi:hypothetical protein H6P81_007474 [Aristolochia fimbriata]|uniref:Integrator complex subunit 7 n=1 Tax=Aristolochia fimbriata TaxID=158543 RepID=A0AAV7F2K0_ARIFI|nr:hypothetical protein H6P81_007474 [Aristolochia fimbriata]